MCLDGDYCECNKRLNKGHLRVLVLIFNVEHASRESESVGV